MTAPLLTISAGGTLDTQNPDMRTKMNRTPEPNWENLPDEILSVDVARLFGIMPKSLSQYVKRGQIDPPVRRESNAAWYRLEDVKTFWRRREQPTAPSDPEGYCWWSSWRSSWSSTR